MSGWPSTQTGPVSLAGRCRRRASEPRDEWRRPLSTEQRRTRSGSSEERWLASPWWRAVCAAGMLLAFVAGSQALLATAQTDIWGGVYTEEQASRGEEVFLASCAFCHGEDLAGSEMGPVLKGSAFIEFWAGLSLADLINVITTSMPQDNPGGLDAAQYADVLAYILQQGEYPAGSAEIPADGSGLEEIEIKTEQGQ